MSYKISTCEVCGNKNLLSVLNLGHHPMCDDLVPLGDQRVCKEYPIEILFCENCLTAHQKFQIPKQELFPKTYHYRSRHTNDVIKGMRDLVRSYEKNFGSLKNKKVLDIGCNDGSLLSFFKKKGAKTFGIEPTDAYNDASEHEVTNNFFSEIVAKDFVKKFGKIDVITFTNVFAHIENLQAVIRALKIVMHEKTIILIENHYLGAVIDKFQFDTFYHEHPRTYSCTSFAFIADSLGVQIGNVEFPSRYNGNIRVTYIPRDSQPNQILLDKVYKREKTFGKNLREMAKKIEPWKNKKRSEIENLVKKQGKLCAKAFPGRAAIIIKLLKLDANLIKATYEKPQSAKVNHYIPGTKIPILSDAEFDFSKSKTPLLNLSWHIAEEIESYMREKGYTGPIVNIISKEDLV